MKVDQLLPEHRDRVWRDREGDIWRYKEHVGWVWSRDPTVHEEPELPSPADGPFEACMRCETYSPKHCEPVEFAVSVHVTPEVVSVEMGESVSPRVAELLSVLHAAASDWLAVRAIQNPSNECGETFHMKGCSHPKPPPGQLTYVADE